MPPKLRIVGLANPVPDPEDDFCEEYERVSLEVVRSLEGEEGQNRTFSKIGLRSEYEEVVEGFKNYGLTDDTFSRLLKLRALSIRRDPGGDAFKILWSMISVASKALVYMADTGSIRTEGEDMLEVGEHNPRLFILPRMCYPLRVHCDLDFKLWIKHVSRQIDKTFLLRMQKGELLEQKEQKES